MVTDNKKRTTVALFGRPLSLAMLERLGRAKVACELLLSWCDSIAIAVEQCVTVSNRDFGDWSQTGNWSQVSGVQSNQSGSLVSKCSVSNTTTIRLITTAEWHLLTTSRLACALGVLSRAGSGSDLASPEGTQCQNSKWRCVSNAKNNTKKPKLPSAQ